MKVTEILPNIYLVTFKSEKDLAMTFIRFQEYYESPKFRNKIFTLEEFKQWYIEKYGKFSYAEDWSGFNIPSSVLEPFIDGRFCDLSDLEIKFLDYFKKVTNSNYYIIGSNDCPDVLEHEICHALFYTNNQYKLEVEDTIRNNESKLSNVFNKVIEWGYTDNVIIDEVNAYVSCNSKWLKTQGIKFDGDIAKQLEAVKLKYMPVILAPKDDLT